jgi:hypothetical protein
MSMMDHSLIELPNFRLPRDLAWRVKLIEAIEDHLRVHGSRERFDPPRFYGYYFCRRHPVVLARHWKVTLEPVPLFSHLRVFVERLTEKKFNFVAEVEGTEPEYLLVHDRFDESCWLWEFEQGRRFVGAHLPVTGENLCMDDPEEWDSGLGSLEN